ncbi:hypothetical protein E1B28_004961 [Marasmius oreades]|uniref:Uncharacterized protein n=1 Tax=Marasmius oreades TaxID=181124 RepID=A0A9P7UZM1_9AGAR|nr:uncharacterized protein E1B28_004961 [Marasmius oreades]KAG7097629.1 hypothetical protein E1B28_004961 [Marasmius oreades]
MPVPPVGVLLYIRFPIYLPNSASDFILLNNLPLHDRELTKFKALPEIDSVRWGVWGLYASSATLNTVTVTMLPRQCKAPPQVGFKGGVVQRACIKGGAEELLVT